MDALSEFTVEMLCAVDCEFCCDVLVLVEFALASFCELVMLNAAVAESTVAAANDADSELKSSLWYEMDSLVETLMEIESSVTNDVTMLVDVLIDLETASFIDVCTLFELDVLKLSTSDCDAEVELFTDREIESFSLEESAAELLTLASSLSAVLSEVDSFCELTSDVEPSMLNEVDVEVELSEA